MPTSEPTLYEVLGVAPDADPAEIKAAFRKRARKMHPDVAGDEMRSFYLLLQHAHEVLSEPGRRAEYDRSLRGGHRRAHLLHRIREREQVRPAKSRRRSGASGFRTMSTVGPSPGRATTSAACPGCAASKASRGPRR